MCSKDETLQNNLIWYRLEWTVVFCEMVLKMYFFNWTLILSWYVISMHFYVNKVLMTTCRAMFDVCLWFVSHRVRSACMVPCNRWPILSICGLATSKVCIMNKYSFINPWEWWFGCKSCPKNPFKFSSVNMYDSSVFSFKLLGN